MRIQRYFKLVRDRIPEIIRANGEHPKFRTLDRSERLHALFEKLTEETNELRAAQTDEERTTEIGDLLEVLHAIQKETGISPIAVEMLQYKRRHERGGYDEGIFLETVKIDDAVERAA